MENIKKFNKSSNISNVSKTYYLTLEFNSLNVQFKLPKAVSDKASRSEKHFICINSQIILCSKKYTTISQIPDYICWYNFNIHIRISSIQ